VHARRSHLVLLGLILAALAGALLLIIPGSPGHKKATLGLDLQGGLEVVLKAVPPKAHTLTADDLNRAVTVMRQRLNKLGVSEVDVRKQGSNQIVVQLPGVHNASKAAQIIGETAQLQLYDLEPDLTGPSVTTQGLVTVPVANPSLYNLLSRVQTKSKEGTPTAYYLFSAKKKLLAGPVDARAKLFNASRPSVPKGGKVLAVPDKTTVVTCGATEVVCPGQGTGGIVGPPAKGSTFYYLFKYDPPTIPEMTGSDLKLSGTRQDFDPNGNAVVLLSFTGAGGKKFHKITKEEWLRGKLQRSEQHFAIVLDGEIKSFPQIDFNDSSLSDGIDPVNGAQITGLSSPHEAKDLAIVLQSGALPVSFQQIERTDVSATLGKDSLRQAKKAALIGLLIVALFLLVLYRFLGVVAVLGLGIYAAFLYAALLIFNVTLTLPGFAGLILTIGVAADANVVIFERIKEEVRSGKSVRAAIAAGYSKGFRTIVDANVVTCITALILFAVATAQVKGFALMLLIGTVISLVTAVAATRAMLGLLGGFRWFENPSFMGAHGEQGLKWLQIDFMRRRYLWFAISGAVIAIGMIALGVKGLNLGIDFKGGTQVTFKTPSYVSLTKVRDQTAAIGQKDAVVQGRGSSHGDAYKSFQIRTKSLTATNQDKLTADLQSRLKATSLGVQNVSSSFGHQIARLAIVAILVSLALIVIYIALRFDFKFAVPVIVALIHDIAITVGIYSLTGREVTTSTVAAVLTVLGYSIYDTIIIFDRIRENVPLMRRSPFATIANVSLWETIRRSLATTFITLLPVTSLLLFGGATLKDFAFALLVGIGSGAYSSIFIAAPLLTIWKEREPEYARRIGLETTEAGAGALALAQAEAAAAAEPEPTLIDSIVSPAPAAAPSGDGKSAAQQKRERRRQRRRTRPHGRAR
jgi:SecD/SecF fusion protein